MTDPSQYDIDQLRRSIAEDADDEDEEERLRIAEQAELDSALDELNYGRDE